VHPYILNAERSGVPVWTGYGTDFPVTAGSRLELVQQVLRDTTAYWHDMTFDSFFAHAALEHMKEKKPRVTWIALSETDEWAHEGRYDFYLEAVHNMDAYVRQLWEQAEAMQAYRGKTTFLITCDHGRGSGPGEWTSHGAKTEGAENIWVAVLGPDTPAMGERTNCSAIYQKQVAATLAALLGEDYPASEPRAAMPIEDAVLRR
jgi:hypothetical protein